MPFSESVKLRVKQRALFRCCRCQEIGIDVHHIVPRSEGGTDTIDNAAPLCQNCHDRFGSNPHKRKELIQMRDYWYRVVADKYARLPDHGLDVAQVGKDILDFIRASLSQNLNPDKLSSESDPGTFALEVRGDSMLPRIHNGDIIVVNARAKYENGDMCVVGVDEEVTLRVVQLDQQAIHLIPLNPIYQPTSVSRDKITFIYKVIRLIADL